MSGTPLRCAVIGVGYLGRFHAQKYQGMAQAELVGVCDLSHERAQQVADELGVKAFTRYQDLANLVDAVTIASPTVSHFEIARFFLQNGIHVHVEKPMTSTSAEGEELCQLAEANQLKLQVGHIERFNPAFIAAREKVQKPLFMECHRLAPLNRVGLMSLWCWIS